METYIAIFGIVMLSAALLGSAYELHRILKAHRQWRDETLGTLKEIKVLLEQRGD